MTVEASIFSAIGGLCDNRVFPDKAPLGTAKPYVTYVQVGGEPVNYTDNFVPSLQNGRFQFNVFSDSRAQSKALMLQIETTLIMSTDMQARPIGALASDYDHDMQIYESRQDFSIWAAR
jgi:hypothetical protein